MRQPEGPFGDHYGYYSLQHDFPIFKVERVWHRQDAIFPATVVGKPKQEDYYIGEYLTKASFTSLSSGDDRCKENLGIC